MICTAEDFQKLPAIIYQLLNKQKIGELKMNTILELAEHERTEYWPDHAHNQVSIDKPTMNKLRVCDL